MQSVLQCSCNIHIIRKTFLASKNLKKHEMHFSTDALPNVRMLQSIFIRLQHKTSHHIRQQKNMLSWGFNLRAGIVCIGFPSAMLLPLWDLWEKLCQNQPLCPEACRISEQQDAHMLLVLLHSKKNHIFSRSKSAFEPHKNLHLDHIELYQ